MVQDSLRKRRLFVLELLCAKPWKVIVGVPLSSLDEISTGTTQTLEATRQRGKVRHRDVEFCGGRELQLSLIKFVRASGETISQVVSHFLGIRHIDNPAHDKPGNPIGIYSPRQIVPRRN